MLVGNLRFSLQAILDWEVANSVPGNAATDAQNRANAGGTDEKKPNRKGLGFG